MLSAVSYILNMKGIPYKTEWVDYPNIADALKKLALGPSSVYGDVPFYTVPAIYDPNTKRALTDSWAIAAYLDEQYPQDPQLFPPRTHALQRAVMARLAAVLRPLFPLLAWDLYSIATPDAQPYLRATREALYKCRLEDVAPTGEKRAQVLSALEAVLDETAEAIRANGRGALFFGGEEPVYVDVFVAALLSSTERIAGKESDVVRMIMAASGGHWVKVLEYFKKYEMVN
jgi:glutathione S-transferase